MKFAGACTVIVALASLVAPHSASAAVQCTLSSFYIDSYDHGGTYLHGTLTGPGISTSLAVNMIDICGTTGGTEDCTAKGTDRRLAIALAAQAQGKSLMVGFASLNSCTDFVAYTRATDVWLAP
jgi:hypothetical protein